MANPSDNHTHIGPLSVDRALTVDQAGKAAGFVLALKSGQNQYCMLLHSAPPKTGATYGAFVKTASMSFRKPKSAEKYVENGTVKLWNNVKTKAQWDSAVQRYAGHVGLLGAGTYIELSHPEAPNSYADWEAKLEGSFPAAPDAPPAPPPPPPSGPTAAGIFDRIWVQALATHEQGRYGVLQQGDSRATLDAVGTFETGTKEVWVVLDKLSRDTISDALTTPSGTGTSAGDLYTGTFDFKVKNPSARIYLATWSWTQATV